LVTVTEVNKNSVNLSFKDGTVGRRYGGGPLPATERERGVMKFKEALAQFVLQVRAVMGKLTPTQRLSVGLLGGAVAVSFVVLIIVSTTGGDGGYVDLFYRPLEPDQQSYVVRKLAAEQFDVVDGVIKVRAQDRGRLAAMFLEDPHVYSEPDWFASLLEPNILETDALRNKKFVIAREKQLSAIIAHFREVKRAFVGINPGDNRIFMHNDLVKATASVNVELKPGVERLKRDTVNAIAGTVAGVIKGLRLEDVRIQDYNGKTYRARPRQDGVPDGNDRLEVTRKISEYYEEKIRSVLNYPGLGVAVYPEINWDKIEEKISTYPDIEEPVYTVEKHSSTGGSKPIGGEVGVSPNVGEDTGVNQGGLEVGASPSSGGGVERSTKTTITKQFDRFNETIKLIERYPGDFDTRTVTVNIPYNYLAVPPSGGEPPEDPEEREKVVQENIASIREQVKRVVGLSNSPEDDQRICVAAAHYIEPPEFVEASFGESFWEYARPLLGKAGVAVFALLALILVAAFIKRNIPKPQQIPIEEIEERIEKEVAKEKKDFVAEMEQMDDTELKAVQVKERVHEMVEENPESAVNLLKSWINKEE